MLASEDKGGHLCRTAAESEAALRDGGPPRARRVEPRNQSGCREDSAMIPEDLPPIASDDGAGVARMLGAVALLGLLLLASLIYNLSHLLLG